MVNEDDGTQMDAHIILANIKGPLLLPIGRRDSTTSKNPLKRETTLHIAGSNLELNSMGWGKVVDRSKLWLLQSPSEPGARVKKAMY